MAETYVMFFNLYRKSSFVIEISPNDPKNIEILFKTIKKSCRKLRKSKTATFVKYCFSKLNLFKHSSKKSMNVIETNQSIINKLPLKNSIFTMNEHVQSLLNYDILEYGDIKNSNQKINNKYDKTNMKIIINSTKYTEDSCSCNCIENRSDYYKNYLSSNQHIYCKNEYQVYPVNIELKLSEKFNSNLLNKSVQCNLKHKIHKLANGKNLKEPIELSYENIEIPHINKNKHSHHNHNHRHTTRSSEIVNETPIMYSKNLSLHQSSQTNNIDLELSKMSLPKELGDMPENMMSVSFNLQKEKSHKSMRSKSTSYSETKIKRPIFQESFLTYVEIESLTNTRKTKPKQFYNYYVDSLLDIKENEREIFITPSFKSAQSETSPNNFSNNNIQKITDNITIKGYLENICEEDITLNEENINLNEENISLNKEDIRLNEEDIRLNEEDIRLNEEDIRLNKEDIRLNKEDIRLNKKDIRLNKEDIPLNKKMITLNKEDITLNEEVLLNVEEFHSSTSLSSKEYTTSSNKDDTSSSFTIVNSKYSSTLSTYNKVLSNKDNSSQYDEKMFEKKTENIAINTSETKLLDKIKKLTFYHDFHENMSFTTSGYNVLNENLQLKKEDTIDEPKMKKSCEKVEENFHFPKESRSNPQVKEESIMNHEIFTNFQVETKLPINVEKMVESSENNQISYPRKMNSLENIVEELKMIKPENPTDLLQKFSDKYVNTNETLFYKLSDQSTITDLTLSNLSSKDTFMKIHDPNETETIFEKGKFDAILSTTEISSPISELVTVSSQTPCFKYKNITKAGNERFPKFIGCTIYDPNTSMKAEKQKYSRYNKEDIPLFNQMPINSNFKSEHVKEVNNSKTIGDKQDNLIFEEQVIFAQNINVLHLKPPVTNFLDLSNMCKLQEETNFDENRQQATIPKQNPLIESVLKENGFRKNASKKNILKKNVTKENISKENILKENVSTENVLKENILKKNLPKTQENIETYSTCTQTADSSGQVIFVQTNPCLVNIDGKNYLGTNSVGNRFPLSGTKNEGRQIKTYKKNKRNTIAKNHISETSSDDGRKMLSTKQKSTMGKIRNSEKEFEEKTILRNRNQIDIKNSSKVIEEKSSLKYSNLDEISNTSKEIEGRASLKHQNFFEIKNTPKETKRKISPKHQNLGTINDHPKQTDEASPKKNNNKSTKKTTVRTQQLNKLPSNMLPKNKITSEDKSRSKIPILTSNTLEKPKSDVNLVKTFSNQKFDEVKVKYIAANESIKIQMDNKKIDLNVLNQEEDLHKSNSHVELQRKYNVLNLNDHHSNNNLLLNNIPLFNEENDDCNKMFIVNLPLQEIFKNKSMKLKPTKKHKERCSLESIDECEEIIVTENKDLIKLKEFDEVNTSDFKGHSLIVLNNKCGLEINTSNLSKNQPISQITFARSNKRSRKNIDYEQATGSSTSSLTIEEYVCKYIRNKNSKNIEEIIKWICKVLFKPTFVITSRNFNLKIELELIEMMNFLRVNFQTIQINYKQSVEMVAIYLKPLLRFGKIIIVNLNRKRMKILITVFDGPIEENDTVNIEETSNNNLINTYKVLMKTNYFVPSQYFHHKNSPIYQSAVSIIDNVENPKKLITSSSEMLKETVPKKKQRKKYNMLVLPSKLRPVSSQCSDMKVLKRTLHDDKQILTISKKINDPEPVFMKIETVSKMETDEFEITFKDTEEEQEEGPEKTTFETESPSISSINLIPSYKKKPLPDFGLIRKNVAYKYEIFSTSISVAPEIEETDDLIEPTEIKEIIQDKEQALQPFPRKDFAILAPDVIGTKPEISQLKLLLKHLPPILERTEYSFSRYLDIIICTCNVPTLENEDEMKEISNLQDNDRITDKNGFNKEIPPVKIDDIEINKEKDAKEIKQQQNLTLEEIDEKVDRNKNENPLLSKRHQLAITWRNKKEENASKNKELIKTQKIDETIPTVAEVVTDMTNLNTIEIIMDQCLCDCKQSSCLCTPKQPKINRRRLGEVIRGTENEFYFPFKKPNKRNKCTKQPNKKTLLPFLNKWKLKFVKNIRGNVILSAEFIQDKIITKCNCFKETGSDESLTDNSDDSYETIEEEDEEQLHENLETEILAISATENKEIQAKEECSEARSSCFCESGSCNCKPNPVKINLKNEIFLTDSSELNEPIPDEIGMYAITDAESKEAAAKIIGKKDIYFGCHCEENSCKCKVLIYKRILLTDSLKSVKEADEGNASKESDKQKGVHYQQFFILTGNNAFKFPKMVILQNKINHFEEDNNFEEYNNHFDEHVNHFEKPINLYEEHHNFKEHNNFDEHINHYEEHINHFEKPINHFEEHNNFDEYINHFEEHINNDVQSLTFDEFDEIDCFNNQFYFTANVNKTFTKQLTNNKSFDFIGDETFNESDYWYYEEDINILVYDCIIYAINTVYMKPEEFEQIMQKLHQILDRVNDIKCTSSNIVETRKDYKKGDFAVNSENSSSTNTQENDSTETFDQSENDSPDPRKDPFNKDEDIKNVAGEDLTSKKTCKDICLYIPSDCEESDSDSDDCEIQETSINDIDKENTPMIDGIKQFLTTAYLTRVPCLCGPTKSLMADELFNSVKEQDSSNDIEIVQCDPNCSKAHCIKLKQVKETTETLCDCIDNCTIGYKKIGDGDEGTPCLPNCTELKCLRIKETDCICENCAVLKKGKKPLNKEVEVYNFPEREPKQKSKGKYQDSDEYFTEYSTEYSSGSRDKLPRVKRKLNNPDNICRCNFIVPTIPRPFDIKKNTQKPVTSYDVYENPDNKSYNVIISIKSNTKPNVVKTDKSDSIQIQFTVSPEEHLLKSGDSSSGTNTNKDLKARIAITSSSFQMPEKGKENKVPAQFNSQTIAHHYNVVKNERKNIGKSLMKFIPSMKKQNASVNYKEHLDGYNFAKMSSKNIPVGSLSKVTSGKYLQNLRNKPSDVPDVLLSNCRIIKKEVKTEIIERTHFFVDKATGSNQILNLISIPKQADKIHLLEITKSDVKTDENARAGAKKEEPVLSKLKALPGTQNTKEIQCLEKTTHKAKDLQAMEQKAIVPVTHKSNSDVKFQITPDKPISESSLKKRKNTIELYNNEEDFASDRDQHFNSDNMIQNVQTSDQEYSTGFKPTRRSSYTNIPRMEYGKYEEFPESRSHLPHDISERPAITAPQNSTASAQDSKENHKTHNDEMAAVTQRLHNSLKPIASTPSKAEEIHSSDTYLSALDVMDSTKRVATTKQPATQGIPKSHTEFTPSISSETKQMESEKAIKSVKYNDFIESSSFHRNSPSCCKTTSTSEFNSHHQNVTPFEFLFVKETFPNTYCSEECKNAKEFLKKSCNCKEKHRKSSTCLTKIRSNLKFGSNRRFIYHDEDSVITDVDFVQQIKKERSISTCCMPKQTSSIYFDKLHQSACEFITVDVPSAKELSEYKILLELDDRQQSESCVKRTDKSCRKMSKFCKNKCHRKYNEDKASLIGITSLDSTRITEDKVIKMQPDQDTDVYIQPDKVKKKRLDIIICKGSKNCKEKVTCRTPCTSIKSDTSCTKLISCYNRKPKEVKTGQKPYLINVLCSKKKTNVCVGEYKDNQCKQCQKEVETKESKCKDCSKD